MLKRILIAAFIIAIAYNALGGMLEGLNATVANSTTQQALNAIEDL